jgi:tetratricopeptide (TPR) repeat protein
MLVGGALSVWFLWGTLKKSEDPGRVLFKWIVTAVVFVILVKMGVSLNRAGQLGPIVVASGAAILGVFMGILWAPHLGALLAKPFTSFYDGGSQEVEERPFYAIARAKQKRGNYQEAIAEVRKQLARFPEDYEGWMFLAEIYAADLKDNNAAQECIQEILRHSNHAAKNIAFALNRSADWFLQLASDREQARESLVRIAALFPDTELAHAAAQRIAHLTSDRMLAEQKERPRIALTRHDDYIGLRGEVADPRPAAADPAATAARLVSHLGEYADDVEAREELARLYADRYERLDLASDQIEQLIATSGAGQKEIARWLNMLADFHVRLGQDKEAARGALQRIIDFYPKSAVAAKAETRIAYLETEMLKNKKSQAVKLGSYENNLGLNRSRGES